MIRHISMFRMEPNPANGKTMEENIEALKAFLETLPGMEPSIVGCKIASGIGGPPADMPDDGPAMFTQVVQMIDFKKPEEVAAWPTTPAHLALVDFTKDMVKKVVAIDFEI